MLWLKNKPNYEYNTDEYDINRLIRKRKLRWIPFEKNTRFLGKFKDLIIKKMITT